LCSAAKSTIALGAVGSGTNDCILPIAASNGDQNATPLVAAFGVPPVTKFAQ
jgi:hypothetical protein